LESLKLLETNPLIQGIPKVPKVIEILGVPKFLKLLKLGSGSFKDLKPPKLGSRNF